MKKYNVELKDPVLAIPVGTLVPEDTFRRDQLDQVFAWNKVREVLTQCL